MAKQNSKSLWKAAEEGNIEAIQKALAAGAEVESTNSDGLTALLIAAKHNRSRAVEYFLSIDANIHASSANGDTLLHFAALNNQFALVCTALEKGINVNARNKEQNTPLHIASKLFHKQIVQVLLDQGATASLVNKRGKTALQVAQKESKKNNGTLIFGTIALLTEENTQEGSVRKRYLESTVTKEECIIALKTGYIQKAQLYFKQHSSLTELDISDQRFGTVDAISRLMQCLKTTRISTLHLNNNRPNSEQAFDALISGLKDTNVQKLALKHNNVSDPSYFIKLLKTCPHIVELDIEGNRCNENEEIKTLLQENQKKANYHPARKQTAVSTPSVRPLPPVKKTAIHPRNNNDFFIPERTLAVPAPTPLKSAPQPTQTLAYSSPRPVSPRTEPGNNNNDVFIPKRTPAVPAYLKYTPQQASKYSRSTSSNLNHPMASPYSASNTSNFISFPLEAFTTALETANLPGIKQYFEDHPSLKELRLGSYTFHNRNTNTTLAKALKDSNVTTLYCNNNLDSSDLLPTFISDLKDTKITSLHLSNMRFSRSVFIKALTRDIGKTGITELHLEYSHFSISWHVEALLQGLEGSNITLLNLSNSTYDSTELLQLLIAKMKLPNLSTLYLRSNNIKDPQLVVDLLKANPHITTLDMTGNACSMEAINKQLHLNQKNNALLKAAEEGDVTRVSLALENGAEVKAVGKMGGSLIHWVALHGWMSMAEQALAGGTMLEARTDAQNTPLLLAARQGNAPLVQYLLDKGADISAKNANGHTAIELAKEHKDNSENKEKSEYYTKTISLLEKEKARRSYTVSYTEGIRAPEIAVRKNPPPPVSSFEMQATPSEWDFFEALKAGNTQTVQAYANQHADKTELRLSFHSFNSLTGIQTLVTYLKISKITHLDLAGNSLNAQNVVTALAHGLHGTNVTHLDLHKNEINHPTVIYALMTRLQNSCVFHLDFWGNELTPPAMTELLAGLKQGPIRSLNMWGLSASNLITKLADGLKDTLLTELYIEDVSLEETDLTYLLSGIKSSNIRKLSLKGHTGLSEYIEQLSRGLHGSNVTDLNIASCDIDDPDPIIELLKQNPQIIALTMDGNSCAMEGITAQLALNQQGITTQARPSLSSISDVEEDVASEAIPLERSHSSSTTSSVSSYLSNDNAQTPADLELLVKQQVQSAVAEMLAKQSAPTPELTNQQFEELKTRLTQELASNPALLEQISTHPELLKKLASDPAHIAQLRQEINLFKDDLDKIRVLLAEFSALKLDVKRLNALQKAVEEFREDTQRKQKLQDAINDDISELLEEKATKNQEAADKKALLLDPRVKAFYHAIKCEATYEIISAFAALGSHVTRNETSKDTVKKLISQGASALLGCVPVVGNILGAAAGTAIEMAGSHLLDARYFAKLRAQFGDIDGLEDAGVFAELLALELTRTYKDRITAKPSTEAATQFGQETYKTMHKIVDGGTLLQTGLGAKGRVSAIVAAVVTEANRAPLLSGQTVLSTVTQAVTTVATGKQVTVLSTASKQLEEKMELFHKQQQVRHDHMASELAKKDQEIASMKQEMAGMQKNITTLMEMVTQLTARLPQSVDAEPTASPKVSSHVMQAQRNSSSNGPVLPQ